MRIWRFELEKMGKDLKRLMECMNTSLWSLAVMIKPCSRYLKPMSIFSVPEPIRCQEVQVFMNNMDNKKYGLRPAGYSLETNLAQKN
jgi:hypothetical protein